MTTVIRLARSDDIPKIERMLKKANVNALGVDKPTARFFMIEQSVMHQPNQFVGTAGVEIFGERALLRSFVLESGIASARTTLEVIRVLLTYIHQLSVKQLFLLTEGPQPFFEELGFVEIQWDELPEDVKASAHVQQTIPTAIPMVYTYSCYTRSN